MLGNISIWQLLIILVIVIMIFGTKKLRSLGGDLGGAIKSFKKAMNEEKPEEKTAAPSEPQKSLEHQAGEKKDADFATKTQENDKR